LTLLAIKHGSPRRTDVNRVLLLLMSARAEFLVPRNLQIDQASADTKHPKSDESRNKKRAANRNIRLWFCLTGKSRHPRMFPSVRSQISNLSLRSQISDLK